MTKIEGPELEGPEDAGVAEEAAVDDGEEVSEGAAVQADLAVAPELVAGSLGEYLRAAAARVKAGDSGVLPVVAGLILISALFQSLNSNFLTSGNMVNLLVQGAAYMLLAMGMVFPLLLGEIDLSIGFVSGIGGVVMAELVRQSVGWPWWAAIAVALLTCAAIGAIQGTIITRLGLPAFIVTLAGLLGFQGVMLMILGTGGSLPINDKVINNLASGNLTPAASWIVILGIVTVFAARLWLRDSRRRTSGLVAPPTGVTVLKIGAAYLAGIAVVVVCNADRGRLVPIKGLPWVVLIVVGVLTMWTLLLGRTKFGRYIYAIGGNPEAARRAGVNLAAIRTLAFTLASFTAGIAGIVYASRLRSVSTALDGGTLVLYAVAAAVIGGTSLFGGRGKAIHAVLGGLVIAAIDNGMGLQGYSAAAKYVVTALVLLAAVTIDAVARRGRTAT
jgi:D-xylose transport system permease protein